MPARILSENLPQVEYLRECLSYSPESGLLTWKHRPRDHFTCDRGHSVFLSSFAGRTAGSRARIGYLSVGIDHVLYYAHRIAWALHYGVPPAQFIDHINGVKDDNRIVNLHDVPADVNQRNQVRRSDNTSGITGVYWHRQRGKWGARIRRDNRNYYLGLYDDINKAIAARQRANERFDFSPYHGQENPNEPFQPILKPSTSQ